jgi:uncharacterized protein YkwD
MSLPLLARLTPKAARSAALAAILCLVAIAPASAVSAKTYDKQVVSATNAYRADHGRSSVKLQKCLDRWANGQARWMADRDKLAHRDGRLRKILRSCKLTRVSENIAWNFSTGTKAVEAWAASPPHAANMRAPKMRYIGVGVARSDTGEIYVSQVFGARK